MKAKPWREVIIPHQDVLEGTFQESEFAADLTKVASGEAGREYQDPILFFERTFITAGMRLMLESVARRMTGQGGDPVVQLQTAFGGGKTHAMLAVYHMARGEAEATSLPGVYSILSGMGIDDLPPARVAILDGNSLSPSQPRDRGSVTTNTLWGEMAWQLGGEEGYRMVAGADRDGTSPGSEILVQLFKAWGPVIILMDETVAYIRQFAEGEKYAGGTFESNITFLQTLTQAASQVRDAMVIASLPESDLEVGGERGRQALRQIQHLFHRVETIWKPVTSEEGFEIVRRRIFQPLTELDARDDACRAFADMYIRGNNYPVSTRESKYLDRLKGAYPIHPEVFDRLYEDWASMENFQRTRGVLRLMAMVAHRLWVDGNKDLLIMPSSLPLYDITIRSEMLRYLPPGWDPVMERDIDGERATTTGLDAADPRFGVVEATRRVARTIFLGSAPTSSGQRIRGLNAEHIRLGCTQPGQSAGVYDDALRRLNDKLYYLYSGRERYWFDTQTNLRREAEDRMNRFNLDEHLVPELGRRLKSMLKGELFAGIHVFTPHGDIPDDTRLRLVVLSPRDSHLWKQKNTQAIKAAGEILANRGQQPRLNQNRLLFLCADEDAKMTLYEQVKRYLAWTSIIEDKEALNLDQHRLKEATASRKEYDDRVDGALRETYKWLLAPYQEADRKGGVSEMHWETQKVMANGAAMVRTIEQVLLDNEMLIRRWSPFHLKNELDKWFFQADRQDYALLNLWNDFCRYPYLPRLVDSTVLQETVTEGIQSRDFFGYASGREGDRYQGLVFGGKDSVYLDEDSLVVHRDAAARQQEEEKEHAAQRAGGDDGDYRSAGSGIGTGVTETGDSGQPVPPKTGVTARRFYGTVRLDPVSAALDFSTIAQEIIGHFSSDTGTTVSVTLEITAENLNGFPEHVQRTVRENSRTLGFHNAEFEEE